MTPAGGHRLSYTQATTSLRRSAVVVGCKFSAEKPFFVRRGGPLYGEGKITKCTHPKPDECHLIVALEQYSLHIKGHWGILSEVDKKWGPCKVGLTGQPHYECKHLIVRHKFRTLSTLAILYHGQHGGNVVASPSVREWCD